MKITPPYRSRRVGERAFTMIEIAIAIGVIGFALVAVIGILPQGMNAQKDNREDTTISQDAPYFMSAIRNGEMRTNGGILTNYVETIYVTNMSGMTTNVFEYNNPYLAPGTNNVLTNDMNIIGLLSLPEFDYRTPIGIVGSGSTNSVTAIVRAMSGSAMQQNGANSATAFRYQMNVEIDAWNFSTGVNQPYFYNPMNNPNLNLPTAPNPAVAGPYGNYLANMLHEIRFKFSWPVLPNGSLGPGRQTYRSLISSHLYVTNVPGDTGETLCFFNYQPEVYTNTTNGY
jgi:type II secretory pathway pseudopilin PulG